MIVSFIVICSEARGEVDGAGDDRQLALARICASEEGLSAPTDGCAAIDAVISNGASRRQVSWMRQARQGSRQSFNKRRGDPRRWIAFLTADGSEPEGWPTYAWRRVVDDDGREMLQRVLHAPWSMPDRRDDFRRRWLRIYERAGRIVRGEERHQCTLNGRREEPVYWGCPTDSRGQCRDHERAERAGWVRLECGSTVRNWFYCDPRMSRSCVREQPDELMGG